jgi:single-strand DNA-binding protein
MLNKVILMGRLTADPELRSTQNGTSVTQFTLAVDRNYQKQGEERQADFINCVAWKQTAEFIVKYFGKGRMIAVEGSIQSRNYEDKQGNKRTAIEVIVSNANFTGEPKQEQGDAEYNELSNDGVPF